MQFHTLTLTQAHEMLKSKEISSVELTRAVLDRITAVEPQIDAFITVTEDQALESAQAADQAIARGKVSAMTGIPLGIKDVLCTRGVRTTCGSRMLENYIPPYDAHVVQRLNRVNAVMAPGVGSSSLQPAGGRGCLPAMMAAICSASMVSYFIKASDMVCSLSILSSRSCLARL